ncbi:MAG: hypothetical protein HQ513_02615 [Rhodospirillales bacterium]|nr:hypothetical protein [Rhodospirillales bacterium]
MTLPRRSGHAIYRKPRGETVAAEEQSAFVPLLRTSHQGLEMAERPNVAPDATEQAPDVWKNF